MTGIRRSSALIQLGGSGYRAGVACALLVAAVLALAPPSSAATSTGTIAGIVTSAEGSSPIAGIKVCASEVEQQLGDSEFELELFGQCATTTASGHYVTPELAAGAYLVYFFAGGSQNYEAQYFSGASSLAGAHLVTVSAGTQTPEVNAALTPGGQIEGTVTNASTAGPVAGELACATSTAGGSAEVCVTTASAGKYVLEGLSAGSYKVEFYSESGAYLTQYFNDEAAVSEANAITVESGHTVPAINAALQPTAQITGKVTDKSTKVGVAGVEVCATDTELALFGQCATSGSGGTYTLAGLSAGSYIVEFSLPTSSQLAYVTQYYNAKANLSEATPVVLKAGQAKTAINAAMSGGAQIAGEVTSAQTKAGVGGIVVCANASSSTVQPRCANTAASGAYTITGLAGGTYDVVFESAGRYAQQYWNGAISEEEAQPITVAAGGSVSAVNAELGGAGAIEGTVTSAASGTALANVNVCASTATTGLPAQCASTGSDGRYAISGLSGGSYTVEFSTAGGSYAPQYWNDAAAPGQAETVSITAGHTASAIDAALLAAATISGQTTASSSGQPLAGVEVCAYGPAAGPAPCTTSNTRGEYALAGLSAGSYKVEFNAPDLDEVTQYYNGTARLEEAQTVSVEAGETKSAIDAAMQRGGTITGRVANGAAAALAGIQVCAYSESPGIEDRCTITDDAGEYVLGGLAPGNYEVEFFSPEGAYLAQYYDEKSTLSGAQPVTVQAETTITAINAALTEAASITGVVTRAVGAAPLSGVGVVAENGAGNAISAATTNAAGEYTLSDLAPGTYQIEFSAPGYLTQFWNDKASLSEADELALQPAEQRTGIGAAMHTAGGLSGTVTTYAGHVPLAGVAVLAERADGTQAGTATTDEDGNYTIPNLNPGSYRIEFSASGFLTQFYDGAATSGQATEVSVAAEQTTAAIDAVMRKGGMIAGTTRQTADGHALSDVEVNILNASGGVVASTTSDENGQYSVGGLESGEYRVQFSSSGYLTQYYDAKASLSEAAEVTVSPEATVSEVDASMQTGGVITGTVTAHATSVGLAGVEVVALEESGRELGSATTGANGTYSIGELPPGGYHLRFSASGYLSQYYDATPLLAEALAVSVQAERTSPNVNATMLRPGSISGVVTAATTKTALPGIEVAILEPSGSQIAITETNKKGEYTLGELEPGTYNVRFAATGYVTQYYNGATQLAEASKVTMLAEEGRTAVNAAMAKGGTITGKVTSSSKTALGGISVAVVTPSGQSVAETTTEGSGLYQFKRLAAGAYKIEFSSAGYATQYWKAKATLAEATTVNVTAGKTTASINATMLTLGAITGTATSSTTKAALDGVEVALYLANGSYVSSTYTAGNGQYEFPELAAGSYKVGFAASGYISQYYAASATLEAGKVVPVKAGKTVVKVNATMHPAKQAAVHRALPGRAGATAAPARLAPDAARPPAAKTTTDSVSVPAASGTTATCPAMKVFGVRGSGETDAEPYHEPDYEGLGHTLKSVADSIRSAVPDASVSMIDYQAIPVAWANVSYYIRRYHDSVDSGITKLDSEITNFVAGPCGQTTYIYLMGYSQGADVVAETYQRRLGSSERSRVQGIALLGDPHFNPSEANVDVGGFRRFGDPGVLVKQLQAARHFTSAEASLVHSYCGFTDGICSSSTLNLGLCAIKRCDHLHYWNEMLSPDQTYTESAAAWLVSRWQKVGPRVIHAGARQSILIFGTGDPQEDPTGSGMTNIVAALRRDGYSVTESSTLPPSIGKYGQVWWYGYRPAIDLPGSDESELVGYAKAGGSLYLTGEWNGCCEAQTTDSAVESMFNSLVLTVGGIGFGANDVAHFPINYSAIDRVALQPDRLTGFYGNLAGSLAHENLGESNFVVTNSAGDGVVGVWNSSEVIGDGRLAIVMDVNWPQNTDGEPSQVLPLATNLAYFLSGGASD
jgi:hypothetical protein